MTSRQAPKACNHDVADPFVRAQHFLFRGIQRFDYDTPERTRVLVVLELWNCTRCGTTCSITVHDSETPLDWDEVPTAVEVQSPLPRRTREPVAERVGYVGVVS